MSLDELLRQMSELREAYEAEVGRLITAYHQKQRGTVPEGEVTSDKPARVHWTHKPENAAKVKKMVRRMNKGKKGKG